MANPLYQQLQQQRSQFDVVNRFMEFRRNFSGDPREQVQSLLNSGRVSQQQYNQAVQMAQQLQGMMQGFKGL